MTITDTNPESNSVTVAVTRRALIATSSHSGLVRGSAVFFRIGAKPIMDKGENSRMEKIQAPRIIGSRLDKWNSPIAAGAARATQVYAAMVHPDF